MDSLDKITLKAFLAGLMRLDDSLPADLQHVVNEIGQAFPSDISKLHPLAKSYPPLEIEYMDAREALQKDGERFRFAVFEPGYCTDIGEEKILDFAVEVLNAEDSVELVKAKAQESSVLGEFLFQLQRQTSFMVENIHSIENIPEEEKWLWQNPSAWASLERGIRQAKAGKVHSLGSFAQYTDWEIDD